MIAEEALLITFNFEKYDYYLDYYFTGSPNIFRGTGLEKYVRLRSHTHLCGGGADFAASELICRVYGYKLLIKWYK